MADVTYIPEGNSQGNNVLPWMLASNGGFGGMNNAWPWLFAMNGGGFGGFGGWGGAGLGGGILGFILGALIGNNGGFGGLFGGGGGNQGAAFLSSQISGDTGRELIMNAINGTDADVRLLATTLNADVNEVRSALSTVQLAIQNVGSQVGMSSLQVVNAIQAGNAQLSHQLCECCCNMRQQVAEQGYQNQIATLNQTNQLGHAIAGVNENIAANRAAQQLSDCQQTYALTDTMNRNYIALDNKIDALESSRKDREITTLTAQVAKLESQNFTAGAIGSAIAPVNAALNALAKEVDDIKCKQPSTVSVQYPNLIAMNATPYVSGGYYQGGFNNGGNYYGPGWGFGFNNGWGF